MSHTVTAPARRLPAYTELHEHPAAVADLPAFVGWTLAGAMDSMGDIRWGQIVAAAPLELAPLADGRRRYRMSVTHLRNVRGVTVPDGAVFSLETPTGAHRVTVSRSIAEDDTCPACGETATRP